VSVSIDKREHFVTAEVGCRACAQNTFVWVVKGAEVIWELMFQIW